MLFRNILYCSAAFILLSSMNGKDTIREDIKKMKLLYSNARSFTVDVRVSLFEKNAEAPTKQFKGVAMKSGINYFSDMMGRLTVTNKNCQVIIDEENKVIIYSDPNARKQFDITPDMMNASDSALFADGAYRIIKETSLLRTAEFDFKTHPTIKKVRITYSKSNFQLIGFEYEMDAVDYSGMKVRIDYSSAKFNTPVAADVFNEKKYVTVISGKIQLTANYKNYQVVDQRPKK